MNLSLKLSSSSESDRASHHHHRHIHRSHHSHHHQSKSNDNHNSNDNNQNVSNSVQNKVVRSELMEKIIKQREEDQKKKDLLIKAKIRKEIRSQQTNNTNISSGPMTKEQYDKKKNTLREVYDEETGRWRLIRGDGEIVERIVTKEKQSEINKTATFYDGLSNTKIMLGTLNQK
ncbi:hypothetical protein WA158_002477 [Blastocystis sp. Blastoise]